MHRLPVESSDITSIGYDAATAKLEIEFHGGRIYQYREVPAEMYEQLMRAESHGQYFNTFIHGHFRYDRLQSAASSQQPKAIAFVSSDTRKFRDLEVAFRSFGVEVEQLALPIEAVQSHDAETVATKKAKHAYHLAGRAVIVEDTFWNIVALRGFPGAYMNYIQEWLKPEDFLKLMADKADRSVVVTDTVVFYDGKRTKVLTTDTLGTMTTEPHGHGTTIDQVVVMHGQAQTIAELKTADNGSNAEGEQTVWHELAKWINIQRRLKRL